MKFNVLPDGLEEPYSVSTPVGDSIVAKSVYRSCPILLSTRVTLVDFVERDILEFDVIQGMDWLPSCFVSNDCRIRVLHFNFLKKKLKNGR